MALEPEIGISMVATLRRGLGALPWSLAPYKEM
jgi:hypothetical protein